MDDTAPNPYDDDTSGIGFLARFASLPAPGDSPSTLLLRREMALLRAAVRRGIVPYSADRFDRLYASIIGGETLDHVRRADGWQPSAATPADQQRYAALAALVAAHDERREFDGASA